MTLFPIEEQKIVKAWLLNPTSYQERPKITNFLKKYYNRNDLIKDFEITFTKLAGIVREHKKFDKDEAKYIENSEKLLNNCLKFDDTDGYKALLLYTFLLHPESIGNFWLFAFCGEPLPIASSNQSLPSFTSYVPNSSNFSPIDQMYYQNQSQQNVPFQQNQSFFSNPPIQSSPTPNQQQWHYSQNYQSFTNMPNQPYFGNPNPSTYNPVPSHIPTENQIRAENPDKSVEALCAVMDYACEFSNESREFINYFLARFLKEGLEIAAKKLIAPRLEKIIRHLQNFLEHFIGCQCQICDETFYRFCCAYNFTFQASISIIDDPHMQFDISEFLINFLDDLSDGNNFPPNFLNHYLECVINKIDSKYFDKKTRKVLSIILKTGLDLTNDITEPQPDIMKNCMEIINKIFNLEKIFYLVEDSDLITDCVRFFYLNRFYEPFRGITQRISNKNLKSKIDLERLDDIIADALAEEEEENEIEIENEGENENLNENVKDKEYKEYVRFFNDLRGKGKKKKNEPLIDVKPVDENIKSGINKAFLMNISDIEAVTPIVESCKEAFQNFFSQQVFEDLDEDQNQGHNINFFLESNEKGFT